MVKVFEGQLNAGDKKFAIIVSRFNELICRKLLEGAIDCLTRHGCREADIHVVWVPGSFEIPMAAKKMAERKKYNAIICLGAVIRGATLHFEYISAEVTKGIALLGLEYGLPVTYGVITPDTLEQALERAGTKAGNKGWDAALSAIEMADLYNKLKDEKKD
ncbi:6,7-dimethyl-8-ribityllumazine synthase [candidate division KSB1 bacterium]|nr:6,7-dimethyl-8-ribityllumazine synthase [candidate division KSB1 bacterium]